jgi:hypothetical protein
LAKDSQGALDAALGDARKRAEAAVSLALAKVRALPNAHAPFTDDVFAAPAR